VRPENGAKYPKKYKILWPVTPCLLVDVFFILISSTSMTTTTTMVMMPFRRAVRT
jgi:hypothetical protein